MWAVLLSSRQRIPSEGPPDCPPTLGITGETHHPIATIQYQCSTMASISVSHAEDKGSIPFAGTSFWPLHPLYSDEDAGDDVVKVNTPAREQDNR